MLKSVKTAALVFVAAGSMLWVDGASASIETRYTGSCKAIVPLPEDKEKRKLGVTDEYVYKQMQKAQEPLGREAHDEALAIVLPLIERTESKAYENAWVRMQVAFIYAQKKSWAKAIEHAKAAIERHALQDAQELQLRQNLIYFYMSADHNAKAVEAALDYFKYAQTPKPEMYVLLGSLYFQLNRYQDAICPTYLAVSKAPAPKKAWLQLLASSHFELKDLEGTAVVMKEIIERFPDEKSVWLQLSSIYLQLNRDSDALALLELAYLKGYVEQEGTLRNLAGLYANSGVPLKAAQILEKAVKANQIPASEKIWLSVGQSYSIAKDNAKAIVAYGEAAKFASDGTYFLYQGEIYAQEEKWAEATAAFNKALEKGGVKNPGSLYLNLGIAQYHQGKTQQALANLEKATQYDRSRQPASSWINFINNRRVAGQ